MQWNPTVAGQTVLDLGYIDLIIELLSLILIIPSNLFVVYLIIRSMKKGKSINIPNTLVLSLSISDLLTGISGYPLRILSYLFGFWLGGGNACWYEQFVLGTFRSFSEYIVILLGIERFLSLAKPFFYEKHCSELVFYVILSIAFLFALLQGTFIMLTHNKSDLEIYNSEYNLYCFPETYFKLRETNKGPRIAYESWLLAQSILLIAAMLFCNISVDRALVKLKKRMKTTCPRNKQEYLKQQDTISGMSREFSRLMTAINFTFVTCMAPSLVRSVCHLGNVWHSMVADFVAWHLLLCTNWINPLLYGMLRRGLRQKCKKIVIKACPCCRSNKIMNINDIDNDDGLTNRST